LVVNVVGLSPFHGLSVDDDIDVRMAMEKMKAGFERNGEAFVACTKASCWRNVIV
jgi:hypothetical protein